MNEQTTAILPELNIISKYDRLKFHSSETAAKTEAERKHGYLRIKDNANKQVCNHASLLKLVRRKHLHIPLTDVDCTLVSTQARWPPGLFNLGFTKYSFPKNLLSSLAHNDWAFHEDNFFFS